VNPVYDALFYEYQREGALISARLVVPLLHGALPIGSVLDVGCGAGAWLKAHEEAGVVDFAGIDGAYVDPALLVIDPARFQAVDIASPFELGRRFDLVQCLEVAEHVPGPHAPVLIDNLVRHGQSILFSAATPGQGGKGHVNERPLGYWRGLFEARGYAAFDYLRPRIAGDRRIEWWYRFNTLLYVQESATSSLPASVRDTRLPPGAPAPDFYPLAMRIRKLVLRTLPAPVVDRLAVMKHRRIVRSLARTR
jgi:SAM-dependent methyltransferase